MESRTAPNLLQIFSNEFHGDALSRVASAIGETPTKTANALRAALPALLASIAGKAASPAGASELLEAIHTNKLDTNQFSSAASSLSAPNSIDSLTSTGHALRRTVLGTRAGGVTDWVAAQAGLSPGSSGSLLSLCLPIILGLIGRRAAGGGVTGLMGLMRGQNFLRDAPAGLGAALGIGDPTAEAIGYREDVLAGRTVREPEHKSSWFRWVLPLALAAGVIWLVTSLFARRDLPRATVPEVNAPRVTTPSVPAAPSVAMPRIDLGALIEKRLPNGVSLSIPEKGVESRLIGFIEDPSQAVDKETWFSFDRLEFETASNQLAASSQEQLRNIAGIMKAYPSVSVKVGGYTDNVGDPAANLKLSQERAQNTMDALAALGVEKARMAAQGYGEQHPVADNSTDEGRQSNRRIDIRVTKK